MTVYRKIAEESTESQREQEESDVARPASR